MKALFVITLLGCSHDLSLCEAIDERNVEVKDRMECAEMAQDLSMDARTDHPVTAFECAPHPVAPDDPDAPHQDPDPSMMLAQYEQ